MDDIDKIVAGQIYARRRTLCLSIKQLSDHAGISCERIQAYEAAQSVVVAGDLSRLADALQVEPAFFFFLPEETASRLDLRPLGAALSGKATDDQTTDLDRAIKALATIESRALREALLTIIKEVARIDAGTSGLPSSRGP